ncbi:MAG: adenylate kinase [Acidobacteriota bacterium]
MTLDLVILGGPGSGKGTQAEELCRALELPHVATGDLFRDHAGRGTELGLLAKPYMDRGGLVPDEVTEAMLEERLARPDVARGFILDGFPRTLPQAEMLGVLEASRARSIRAVLFIMVPDDAIVARLSGRLICRRCQASFHDEHKPPRAADVCDTCGGPLSVRDDDRPETVRERLRTFHSATEPVAAYYRAAGLLREIDGEGAIGEVVARCLAAVRDLS